MIFIVFIPGSRLPFWFFLLVLGHPWGIGSKHVIFGAASCGSRLSLYCLRSGKTVRSHAKGPGPPAHALHQSTYLLLVYFSATWNMLPPLLKKCSPPSAGNWVKTYCRVRSHCWVASIEVCEVGVGLNPSQPCEGSVANIDAVSFFDSQPGRKETFASLCSLVSLL